MVNTWSGVFSEKEILCSSCLMGSGGTQVLLCALQCCSGAQQCWGLCDLSMVALLCFAIVTVPDCPSFVSSRPKDMVWFHSGVHSFLWEGDNAKEHSYSRGNSEGKNLESSLHSPSQLVHFWLWPVIGLWAWYLENEWLLCGCIFLLQFSSMLFNNNYLSIDLLVPNSLETLWMWYED